MDSGCERCTEFVEFPDTNYTTSSCFAVTVSKFDRGFSVTPAAVSADGQCTEDSVHEQKMEAITKVSCVFQRFSDEDTVGSIYPLAVQTRTHLEPTPPNHH